VLRCLGVAVALAGVAGCGDDADRYREVTREQLAVLAETNQVLQSVKDEPSMREARGRLEQLTQRAATAARRAQTLPLPAPTLKERLEAEFGDRLADVMNQRVTEVRRIQGLTGGEAFLDKLGLLAKGDAGS
jgi:hypothetical protein